MEWNQPPGWAVQEAREQLDDDVSWDEIAELAWSLVDAEEDESLAEVYDG
jgi:hypothetical protein